MRQPTALSCKVFLAPYLLDFAHVRVMIRAMQPDFATIFPLRTGRVHEAFGPGAAAFAVMAAGQGRALCIPSVSCRYVNRLKC